MIEQLRSGEFAGFWHSITGDYEIITRDKLPRWGIQGLKMYPWPQVVVPDGRVQRVDEPYISTPVIQDVQYEVSEFSPIREQTLHRRFSQLGDDQSEILAFASQYGLLTDGHRLCLASPREQRYPPHIYVESLSFWRSEIRTMRRLVWLWDKTKGNPQRLAEHVRWHDTPVPEWAEASWAYQVDITFPLKLGEPRVEDYIAIGFGGPEGSDGRPLGFFDNEMPENLFDPWTPHDPVAPARFYVSWIVNSRMKDHVRPFVLVWRPGEIVLWPDSLLAAMYAQFALELTGRTRPAQQCPGCGIYFIPSHGRQRYCEEACRKRHWDRENR